MTPLDHLEEALREIDQVAVTLYHGDDDSAQLAHQIRSLVTTAIELQATLRAQIAGKGPAWKSFQDAPKDGRKIIMGSVAKFVPYKDPSKVGGKAGRWQVRNEFGAWRNCDLQADYWLDGYKVDAPPAPQPDMRFHPCSEPPTHFREIEPPGENTNG